MIPNIIFIILSAIALGGMFYIIFEHKIPAVLIAIIYINIMTFLPAIESKAVVNGEVTHFQTKSAVSVEDTVIMIDSIITDSVVPVIVTKAKSVNGLNSKTMYEVVKWKF
jgi:hypothetical protein